MRHKLRVAFYAVLALGASVVMTGVPASVATAQQNTQTTAGNNIDVAVSGLWAGSNFDLSITTTTTEPEVIPETPPTTSNTYAALGDSVAAGLGLASTDAQCGKSSEAYVHQVAEKQNLPVAHIACSGATMGDLFTKQRMEGPNIAPQLNVAFANGTPQLITITAGANDVHWADFVAKCYAQTCGTSTDDRAANAYLSWLELKMEYALYQIERRSHGTPPPIVFTGYYNPISEACTAFDPRLTTEEVQWLSSKLDSLNQTIEDTAANRSYASFAPVDFAGHDICSADSWVQGPQDAAPFHPTAAGQQAIARSVLEVL
jgi:lysophospholipase L1-like esterase